MIRVLLYISLCMHVPVYVVFFRLFRILEPFTKNQRIVEIKETFWHGHF